MKWKKKSRLYYVSLCIFYFVVFIAFLVYFDIFNSIFNMTMDVRTVRALRDVMIIVYVPQYVFLVIAVIRAIGFDIKKFDFKKDLADLDIAEEDQEEIEVTFGQNAYKYKRRFRRICREIKYYALENKFFFGTICGTVVLVLAFAIYMNFTLHNNKFDESEFFTVNGVVFKVVNSYISDVDLNGKVIKDDSQFVVIKVNMKNNNNRRVNLTTEDLRLMLDDEAFYPVFTRNEYFKDLGEGWYKNNTLYSGEEYDYLLIYEVPKDIKYRRAIFRMVDNVSIINGELSAKYKDVLLDLLDYRKEDKSESYSVGEAISLEDSTLGKSEVVVNSYEFGNSFVELYEYCLDKCYSGKKIIKPDTLGVNDRTILKLNMELVLQDGLYINKFLTSSSNFISLFGGVSYVSNNTTYNVNSSVKALDFNTSNVYLEVPSVVKDASQIKY